MDNNQDNQLSKEFKLTELKYKALGPLLCDIFEKILTESNIKYLSIYNRVKTEESFTDKIERKGYTNPLNEIEDILGIRIICFFQKDIKFISNKLIDELTIHESTTKEEKLDSNQFGYRSHHLIASISPEWKSNPSFRDLCNLKFEIQIRTILMHAWAEIEHSLNYKSELDIPKQFKRKLFRISAKLEEADEQFEELKLSIQSYQQEIRLEIQKRDKDIHSDHSEFDEELNLNSLQAFLDAKYPNRKKSNSSTATLLEELNQYSITFQSLIESNDALKENIPKIEFVLTGNKELQLSQTGIARSLLNLSFPHYLNRSSNLKKVNRYKKIKDELI